MASFSKCSMPLKLLEEDQPLSLSSAQTASSWPLRRMQLTNCRILAPFAKFRDWTSTWWPLSQVFKLMPACWLTKCVSSASHSDSNTRMSHQLSTLPASWLRPSRRQPRREESVYMESPCSWLDSRMESHVFTKLSHQVLSVSGRPVPLARSRRRSLSIWRTNTKRVSHRISVLILQLRLSLK